MRYNDEQYTCAIEKIVTDENNNVPLPSVPLIIKPTQKHALSMFPHGKGLMSLSKVGGARDRLKKFDEFVKNGRDEGKGLKSLVGRWVSNAPGGFR